MVNKLIDAPEKPSKANRELRLSIKYRHLDMYLLCIVSIINIGIVFFYIESYSVNVPYYDEWKMVPTIHSWINGQLKWKDIFTPHDGHIIAIQNITSILSLILLKWDIRFECWAGFAFVIGAFIILCNKYFFKLLETPLLVSLPFSLVIIQSLFSLRQWENLLAPWAINPFSSTFFFLLSIHQLEKKSKTGYVIALISAILASFSFTNGLLIWPIGFFLILSSRNHYFYVIISIWILSTIIILTSFIQKNTNSFQESLNYVSLMRAIGLLGSWFSSDKSVIGVTAISENIDFPVVFVFGIIFIFLIIFILWRTLKQKKIQSFIFPLSIFSYGFLSVGLIAVGHSNLGLSQIISSRYSSTTSLVFIGLICLVFELWHSTQNSKRCKEIVIIGVILSTIISVSNISAMTSELIMGKYRKANLIAWQSHILNYKLASDNDLSNPHFTPNEIRIWSNMMEVDGTGPYNKLQNK